jgi:hypothetical protein
MPCASTGLTAKLHIQASHCWLMRHHTRFATAYILCPETCVADAHYTPVTVAAHWSPVDKESVRYIAGQLSGVSVSITGVFSTPALRRCTRDIRSQICRKVCMHRIRTVCGLAIRKCAPGASATSSRCQTCDGMVQRLWLYKHCTVIMMAVCLLEEAT